MTDPASLITPGATWQLGAWTPARCELWRQLGPKGRKWLEDAVMAEVRNGRCHETQLPPETSTLDAISWPLAGETVCGASRDRKTSKHASAVAQ